MKSVFGTIKDAFAGCPKGKMQDPGLRLLPCGSRSYWDVKEEGDHKVIIHLVEKVDAIQYGRDLTNRQHLNGRLGQLRIRP